MRRLVLVAALVMSLTTPAGADYTAGWIAYTQGDYATAAKEWRTLAEQGNDSLQLELGVMYELGRGVSQDNTEAAKWYRLAADQGNVWAQFAIGTMYDQGRGVPQDYAKAAQWYRLAAKQGHTSAQYNLGLMYAEGRGVPQDNVDAYMRLNLAALLGHEWAARDRDAMAKKMTSSDVSNAQRLAREWMAKHLPKQ